MPTEQILSEEQVLFIAVRLNLEMAQRVCHERFCDPHPMGQAEVCKATADAIKDLDTLCGTVQSRLSEVEKEQERLLKLYNEAWLWVQQRVKHPNTGQPPAALTLIEMLPLLNQRVINLCKEKVTEWEAIAMNTTGLERDSWLSKIVGVNELREAIENLDHKE